MASGEKNPVFVESGRRGALKRWGGQRVVRLDDLTRDQRELVLRLIDVVKIREADEAVRNAA